MKVRVVFDPTRKEFLSEYLDETARIPGWNWISTSSTLKETKEECIKFARDENRPKVMWTDEVE